MKHFVSLKDFSAKNIKQLVALSLKIKKSPKKYKNALKDKVVGLVFQKPSLRTKTSFYVGALQMGADVVYYGPDEVKLGKRESIADGAKVMARYLDAVVIRTFAHEIIAEYAKNSKSATINALSDKFHPSQVLGDLLTLQEKKKDIKKIKIAFVGDGNNVCNSLIYAAAILGGNIAVATPKGYEPKVEILEGCRKFALKSNAAISVMHNPKEAVKNADVIYTDVWTSMGDEREAEKRKKQFKKYIIDTNLLKAAKKNVLVMHCLPAHRGEEISAEVMDGKNSVVFDQAENRLYSAKAILLYALGGKK